MLSSIFGVYMCAKWAAAVCNLHCIWYWI